MEQMDKKNLQPSIFAMEGEGSCGSKSQQGQIGLFASTVRIGAPFFSFW